MTIESAYREHQGKPAAVMRWERLVVAEPETATTQLIYELLIETRRIKLILIWVLIVVPVIVFGVLLTLFLIGNSQVSDPYDF